MQAMIEVSSRGVGSCCKKDGICASRTQGERELRLEDNVVPWSECSSFYESKMVDTERKKI